MRDAWRALADSPGVTSHMTQNHTKKTEKPATLPSTTGCTGMKLEQVIPLPSYSLGADLWQEKPLWSPQQVWGASSALQKEGHKTQQPRWVCWCRASLPAPQGPGWAGGHVQILPKAQQGAKCPKVPRGQQDPTCESQHTNRRAERAALRN